MRPSTAHISCSCSESRAAYGWLAAAPGSRSDRDREHVAAHRVGQHRGRRRHLAGHHRVEHLRRQQQRHRGATGLVGLDVGVEGLVEQVAVDAAQLAEVLHAVDALPLGAAPLFLGDVGEAGQPAPVGLDELACRVLVGLFEHGASMARRAAGLRNTGDLYGRIFGHIAWHARFFCNERVRRERRVLTIGRSGRLGVHRVLDPAGVLPQAARRLDADPADRARRGAHRRPAAEPRRRLVPPAVGGLRRGRRRRCAPPSSTSSPTRGKMQNPVTGSGGMLIGVVDAVGPESPLGLAVGDRVATLVSLTLTPLRITDGLARWDGRSEQVPADGHGDPLRPLDRRRPARRPARRRLARRPGRLRRARPPPPAWCERAGARLGRPCSGAAGKSGSLASPRPGPPGADRLTGLVRDDGRGGRADAPPASPTASWSPTPPTRSRSPRRSATPGRRHRRLRRRAGRRARRDPGHGRRRHRGLLLHGDVVLGGGPGRGGDGGGRDHAGRQRLHARATRPWPSSCTAREPGVRAR